MRGLYVIKRKRVGAPVFTQPNRSTSLMAAVEELRENIYGFLLQGMIGYENYEDYEGIVYTKFSGSCNNNKALARLIMEPMNTIINPRVKGLFLSYSVHEFQAHILQRGPLVKQIPTGHLILCDQMQVMFTWDLRRGRYTFSCPYMEIRYTNVIFSEEHDSDNFDWEDFENLNVGTMATTSDGNRITELPDDNQEGTIAE